MRHSALDDPALLGQIRSLLSTTKSHAHAHVGNFSLVVNLWKSLGLDSPPKTRGATMRAVLWYLIEWHQRRVERHEGPCPLPACAEVAGDIDWHMLWHARTWNSRDGFHTQLTLGNLEDLGREAAATARQPTSATGARGAKRPHHGHTHDGPPQRKRNQTLDVGPILEQAKVSRLDDFPIRLERRSSWYRHKSRHVKMALLAHLRADDPLLRAAFVHVGLRLPAAPPPATALSAMPAVTSSTGAEQVAPAVETHAPEDARHISSVAPGTIPAVQAMPTAQATRSDTARPLAHASVGVAGVRLPGGVQMSTANNPPPAHRGRHNGHTGHRARGSRRGRRQIRRATWWLSQVRWILPLAATLLLAVTYTLSQNWAASMRMPTRVPLAAAHVAGFIVAQQWTHDEARVLVVIDPRSGATRTLWPVGQDEDGAWVPPAAPNGYIWLTSPAYEPGAHLLAFSARNPDGSANLWEVPLTFGSDGWPSATSAGARELAAGCRPCDRLAWSPSGAWLLYNGATGLVALTPTTPVARKIVTTTPGDGWPACSADGRWLAFQRKVGDIVALPTWDCLPLAGGLAWTRARYLEGFAPAWRPAWSPDGVWLAFVSALGGPWSVYVVSFATLTHTPEAGERDAAYLESSGGCTDPLWVRGDTPTDNRLAYSCYPTTTRALQQRLVFLPEAIQPAWQALLTSGTINRDSLCWIAAAVAVAAPMARLRFTPRRQSLAPVM